MQRLGPAEAEEIPVVMFVHLLREAGFVLMASVHVSSLFVQKLLSRHWCNLIWCVLWWTRSVIRFCWHLTCAIATGGLCVGAGVSSILPCRGREDARCWWWWQCSTCSAYLWTHVCWVQDEWSCHNQKICTSRRVWRHDVRHPRMALQVFEAFQLAAAVPGSDVLPDQTGTSHCQLRFQTRPCFAVS